MLRALPLLLLGCASPTVTRSSTPAPLRAELLDEVIFEGMCDASGAIAVSGQTLVVADDEDNVLRVYDAERGGVPSAEADVSVALGLPLKGKREPRHPEVDLEAATLLGDRAYWISSHGRNAKGKRQDERLQFFATTVSADAAGLEVIGSYGELLHDLLADPRYASFGLVSAAELPPKAPGGLNIEGLIASPEGHLLIGFRNPIPDGRALIAPLLDPATLVDGDSTGAAIFGEPVQLDLGGLAIRSLSWWRGSYLVIAGAPAEGGVSRLYTWDGRGAPVPIELDLSAYNPEGFFSPEDRDEIMLLSDDGSRLIDGAPCKDAEDPAVRRFRGVWVRLSG